MKNTFFTLFLFFVYFLMVTIAGKVIYEYNVDPLLPFDVPGSAKQLLPSHFICESGWIGLMMPPYATVYVCNADVRAGFGSFALRLEEPLSFPMDVDSDKIITMNVPWAIEGTCPDVVNLCAAPSDTVAWSKTCEDAILATYHVCQSAILIAMDTALIQSDWSPYHNQDDQSAISFVDTHLLKINKTSVLLESLIIVFALILLGVILWIATVAGIFYVVRQNYVRKPETEKKESPSSYFEQHTELN